MWNNETQYGFSDIIVKYLCENGGENGSRSGRFHLSQMWSISRRRAAWRDAVMGWEGAGNSRHAWRCTRWKKWFNGTSAPMIVAAEEMMWCTSFHMWPYVPLHRRWVKEIVVLSTNQCVESSQEEKRLQQKCTGLNFTISNLVSRGDRLLFTGTRKKKAKTRF